MGNNQYLVWKKPEFFFGCSAADTKESVHSNITQGEMEYSWKLAWESSAVKMLDAVLQHIVHIV